MNLLPRDFKDINCSTSVYRSLYTICSYDFTYLRFRARLGFSQGVIIYWLIILLLSIIRKYPTNFFSHKRDINRSEGLKFRNEVTLSDNFISNARIYSGGCYGWSAFHVSRQLGAINKLFESNFAKLFLTSTVKILPTFEAYLSKNLNVAWNISIKIILRRIWIEKYSRWSFFCFFRIHVRNLSRGENVHNSIEICHEGRK